MRWDLVFVNGGRRHVYNVFDDRDVAEAAAARLGTSGASFVVLPHVGAAAAPAIDIVGGGRSDPGVTELDDAIEQIVGDYVPDSLLRVQLAKRVLAEVVKRTGLDPFARPVEPELPALRALASAVRAWADPASNDEDGTYTDAVYNALAALPVCPEEAT